MTEKDYEKLNNYLNSIFLKLDKIDPIFIDFFKEFIYISEEICKKIKYDSKMREIKNNLSYNDVLLLAREIIETIDKSYLSAFDSIINNGVLDFNFPETEDYCEYNNSYFNGYFNILYIDRKYSYTDVTTLIHEFFHLTNDTNHESHNLIFLKEYISIVMEEYSRRYLFEKGLIKEEVELNKRIYSLIKTNNNFNRYILILIAYEYFGNINKDTNEDLKEYIHIDDATFEKECKELLNELEKDETKEYAVRCQYRYIFGTLMAYYSLEHNKLNEVNELNKKINTEEYAYYSIKEIFSKMGIELSKETLSESIDIIKKNINQCGVKKL